MPGRLVPTRGAVVFVVDITAVCPAVVVVGPEASSARLGWPAFAFFFLAAAFLAAVLLVSSAIALEIFEVPLEVSDGGAHVEVAGRAVGRDGNHGRNPCFGGSDAIEMSMDGVGEVRLVGC